LWIHIVVESRGVGLLHVLHVVRNRRHDGVRKKYVHGLIRDWNIRRGGGDVSRCRATGRMAGAWTMSFAPNGLMAASAGSLRRAVGTRTRSGSRMWNLKFVVSGPMFECNVMVVVHTAFDISHVLLSVLRHLRRSNTSQTCGGGCQITVSKLRLVVGIREQGHAGAKVIKRLR
jgi:hypothetical protein